MTEKATVDVLRGAGISVEPSAPDGLFALLAAVDIGDVILVARHPGWDDWRPHPHGVVIKVGDKYLLNGVRDDTSEARIWWASQSSIRIDEAVLTRAGHRWVIRNGEGCHITRDEQLLFAGEWNEFMFHPNGAMIRAGNDFYLIVVKD